MNQHYTSGFWIVKKGKEEDFVKEWKNFAEWTEANIPGGTGKGYLLQDLDNSQTFISFGEWKSLEDINSWRSTEEFKSFLERMKEYCDKIEPHTAKLRATSE